VDRSTFILQVGRNLKRLRKKRGFTQQQLAIDCEMEISQISRIEKGGYEYFNWRIIYYCNSARS